MRRRMTAHGKRVVAGLSRASLSVKGKDLLPDRTAWSEEGQHRRRLNRVWKLWS